MRKLALALLLALLPVSLLAQGNTKVAACSTAAPGMAWGTQWLPCSGTVNYVIPNANTIIAIQSAAANFANFWNYASTAQPADHVWDGTKWQPSSVIFPIPSGPVVTITWSPTTQNVDGSPVTGTITYNLFQGPSGGPPLNKIQSGITTTSAQVTTGIPPNTVQCWAVTAVASYGESAQTNPPACISFISNPTAPGKITATVSGVAATASRAAPTKNKKK